MTDSFGKKWAELRENGTETNIWSFDVEQLYPSIDPEQCKQIVFRELMDFYRNADVSFWAALEKSASLMIDDDQ